MTTRHDLLAYLARHVGEANGATCSQIAGNLHTDERRVRALISALREDGIAVCGHPATGYYIARTPEELERTCAFLRSRAMHSLVLESRLRQIPLPELLGQLHLVEA